MEDRLTEEEEEEEEEEEGERCAPECERERATSKRAGVTELKWHWTLEGSRSH